MKLPTMLPLLALMALLTFSCSTDSIDESIEEAIEYNYVPDTKIIEIEILELINDHRISLGLNGLTDMSTIKAVAFGHTDYMIEVDNVSHDNFYQRKTSLEQNANATRARAFWIQHPAGAVNNIWGGSATLVWAERPKRKGQ